MLVRLGCSSLIRLIEARFGVLEPYISKWRRQTVGDMTSAFCFRDPARFPTTNSLKVAATTAELLEAQSQVANNPAPQIPVKNGKMPR